jgi:hypothetical protein
MSKWTCPNPEKKKKKIPKWIKRNQNESKESQNERKKKRRRKLGGKKIEK